jgi:hypothetical protein
MSSEYLLALISKNLHVAEQYLLSDPSQQNSNQNEIANARFLISSRFKILRELMNEREQKISEKVKSFEIIKISAKIKNEIKQTDLLIGKLETLVHGKISKLEKHILSRIKEKEKSQLGQENELKELKEDSKENIDNSIEKEKEYLNAKRVQYEKLIENLRLVWTKFNNIERDEGRSGEGFNRTIRNTFTSKTSENIFSK